LVFNQLFQSLGPALGELINNETLSSNILANIELAPVGILIVTIWQKIALPIVLLLGGLQSVPDSILEAAEIDGANKVQIFFRIVFPYLVPVFCIVLVLTLRDSLTVFDYILAMTGGGPAGSTESLSYLIYQFCFVESKFGYGVSLSVALGAVIAIISFIQIKFLSRLEVEV
jgi:raffinose/stachyose/melibiose transport system permease protein